MAKKDIDSKERKPNQVLTYTSEQLQELKRCSEDCLYFIRNYVKIMDVKEGTTVLFEPWDFQEETIKTMVEYRNVVMLFGRQMSKTTCAAAYLLWEALFKPDQTILVVGNILSAATEVMTRIRNSYEQLPVWLCPGTKVDNVNSMCFDNGSRIIARATTKNSARGLTLSILFCLSGDTTVQVRDKQTGEIKTVDIAELYSLLGDADGISLNDGRYEILTPSGWRDFGGVSLNGSKEVFKITFDDSSSVKSSKEHCFFSNSIKVSMRDIQIGSVIDSDGGFRTVISKELVGVEEVYDIVEVADEDHQFFVNGGIVTKNCDELSFLDPPQKAVEFWAAVRPTLSTGGKCIIASTPGSDEDLFAQIYKSATDIFDENGFEHPKGIGKNGFKALKYTWEKHPRRDAEWERAERAAMGDDVRFEREHNCKFMGVDDTLIDSRTLTTLSGSAPLFTQGTIRWYKRPQQGKTYLIGLDPSLGYGGDNAAIQVFELPEMVQVAEWQNNRTDIPGQVKLIKDIIKFIKEETNNKVTDEDIFWSVENNSIGEGANIVIKELGEDVIGGSYISEKSTGTAKRRKGFYMSNKNKLEVCSKFKSMVERGRITINSKPLISEMKTFVSRGAGFAASGTGDDDLVTSTLLVIKMLDRLKNMDDIFRKAISESTDGEEDENFRQPSGVF